jgi:hypothetical protein
VRGKDTVDVDAILCDMANVGCENVKTCRDTRRDKYQVLVGGFNKKKNRGLRGAGLPVRKLSLFLYYQLRIEIVRTVAYGTVG